MNKAVERTVSLKDQESMEISLSQKSLERVVSQRALQLGSSISCQSYVVGFLCGVCLTSLCLAALSSFGSFELGKISFSTNSLGLVPPSNSTSQFIDMVKRTESNSRQVENERSKGKDSFYVEKLSLLYSAWSAVLDESMDGKGDFSQTVGLSQSKVPRAPHLEDCKLNAKKNELLDRHAENGSYPPWTGWKEFLDMNPAASITDQTGQYLLQATSEGTYPPWISGSDEENFPLTRRVQRDIWIHQHPSNCKDPSIKFLVADWERLPGFGVGAQFAGMCGLLAIAIKENRVLVTNYYNRADHDGCKGASQASWSCYFFPETSRECRDHAFELMDSKEAWQKGTITVKENYTSKQIWAGRTPRKWGEPWTYMQPTTDINGTLLTYHRKMDRRWWRAQALRYLMRYQSENTCNLMNAARHAAFGKQAAKLVIASMDADWPKDDVDKSNSDIEEFVWSTHKPWTPRPLLSMHVRMGDKACEMKVVEFEEYMLLAARIRKRFPHLDSIWLSTEMQEVINKSKRYAKWKFYYTNVTRQMGNITMAKYEASLGRKTSTNYPLVNFLMASEADFFIGALGSTWCFLIDGMRNTGGKVMAGYLSVNKDRFW